jgi:hypothetical protein
MSNFRRIDRDTGFLVPPSGDEGLPKNRLARFVVEVIAELDLQAITGSYRVLDRRPILGGVAGHHGLWLRDRPVFEPQLEEQLKAEVSELEAAVAKLTARAEAADQADLSGGLSFR